MQFRIVGPPPKYNPLRDALGPNDVARLRLDADLAIRRLDRAVAERSAARRCTGCNTRDGRIIGGRCDRCAYHELFGGSEARTTAVEFSYHPAGRILSVR